MSLDAYPEIIQGTPEWHDVRRGMVTASGIGQLLSVTTLGAIGYYCPACDVDSGHPCQSKRAGAGPIKTMHPERVAAAAENPVQVIEPARGDTARSYTRLLVAERITGFTEPTFASDDMLRGQEDEPRALDVYAEHYAPVSTLGFMVRHIQVLGNAGARDAELGFSPDGLVGTDGFVEVKSRRQKKHLQTVLDDEVPAENMAQIQTGFVVSEREWCDYISYSGGMAMWKKRVYPDPKWREAIIDALDLFERNAVDMVATYRARTEGLPMTERAFDPYADFVV